MDVITPGNRWTNVCCMVPKKAADAILEVLNSKNLAWINSHLARVCLQSLDKKMDWNRLYKFV